MELENTKHVYIDRDMPPDLLTLIRLEEAVTPKVVWGCLAVGIVTISQWVISFAKWCRSLFHVPTNRARVPTITWPIPSQPLRQRGSDPSLSASSLPEHSEDTTSVHTSLLEGLAQLLREGLRRRGGTWACFR